jgi:hypothetical protein
VKSGHCARPAAKTANSKVARSSERFIIFQWAKIRKLAFKLLSKVGALSVNIFA